jgi:hypothetical protein
MLRLFPLFLGISRYFLFYLVPSLWFSSVILFTLAPEEPRIVV